MRDHDPALTLRQVCEFFEEVATLVKGRTRADLERGPDLRRALERCVELIGEAVNRLPEALMERHGEIPWREIIGMRNVLIHGYDAVNLDVLWDTAVQDIPRLLEQVKAIQREEGLA